MNNRLHRLAFWLGLIAVVLMHVGPLISGALAGTVTSANLSDVQWVQVLEQDLHCTEVVPGASSSLSSEVDYHALMGHSTAQTGLDWLDELLLLCGYCELLTLNPLLIIALCLVLATAFRAKNPIPYQALFIPSMPDAGIRLSRAPPVLFA